MTKTFLQKSFRNLAFKLTFDLTIPTKSFKNLALKLTFNGTIPTNKLKNLALKLTFDENMFKGVESFQRNRSGLQPYFQTSKESR